ncbi:MAG TPA: copper resistance CopC family protein [Candidatus Limnocylindria bacterium]
MRARHPPIQAIGRGLLAALRAMAIAAMAMAAMAAPAAAHAFPASSNPAPGENLDTAPAEVSITFDEEVDPDGSSFRVKDEGGTVVGEGTVDLTVADRNVLRGGVDVTDPGLYEVTWTALSIDGDTTHGSFTFGYRASGAVPSDAPQEEAPNTALPAPTAPSPPVLWLAGVLLLAMSAFVGLRRLRRRGLAPPGQ